MKPSSYLALLLAAAFVSIGCSGSVVGTWQYIESFGDEPDDLVMGGAWLILEVNGNYQRRSSTGASCGVGQYTLEDDLLTLDEGGGCGASPQPTTYEYAVARDDRVGSEMLTLEDLAVPEEEQPELSSWKRQAATDAPGSSGGAAVPP